MREGIKKYSLHLLGWEGAQRPSETNLQQKVQKLLAQNMNPFVDI